MTQVISAPLGRRYALPDDSTAALAAGVGEALAQLGLAGAVPVRRIEDAGAMIARGVRQPPVAVSLR